MTFKQFRNKPIIKIISNRYVIILTVFIVWMTFFDENSFLMHQDFNNEMEKLNKEKSYYQKEIEHDNKIIDELKDPEKLEKFAREEYLLKKENEEIFIIEYDTLKKK